MCTTCVVCGNTYYMTKYTRPELGFHRFPVDANLRKKWLEVLKLDHCKIWHKVCSDHFLKEDYKLGAKKRILFPNIIPQPYDQNGFPKKYIIRINDVETGDHAVLPMEQNIIIKEEDIGNTVVNNFKTQRQSSTKIKSIRINNDGNYYEYFLRTKIEKRQFPLFFETGVKPVLTATKDLETNCSIPGCKTNSDVEDVDKIYLLTPPIECINKRHLALGLPLTENCSICERHFRPQDLIGQKLLDNSLNEEVTLLVPSALPIPINAVRSASNARNNLPDNTDKCSKSNTSMKIDDFSTIKCKNSSQCEIIDYGNTKEFKKKDHGFIFEISKTVLLPSLFWKIYYHKAENTATFCYQLFSETTVKKIDFSNSLEPIVQVYGKIYKYNDPIRSKNKLENLLKKIHDLQKCSGFVYQKCIGYFDGSSEDTQMCSACQERVTNQEI